MTTVDESGSTTPEAYYRAVDGVKYVGGWPTPVDPDPLVELTFISKDGSPCTETFRTSTLRDYAKRNCRTCWGRGHYAVELHGETRNDACRCTNRRIRWGFHENW